MRHYYDVYSLPKYNSVRDFMDTDAYKAHRRSASARATIRTLRKTRHSYSPTPKPGRLIRRPTHKRAFLYYNDKPTFEQILAGVAIWADRL